MAEDTVGTTDPLLDGALERFERAEAELEETEERRRRLSDEASRAASELRAVLDSSIEKAIARRDQLEEELAVVLDHIARLEAMRNRSSGTPETTVETPEIHRAESTVDLADDDGAAAYAGRWDDLTKSRDGSVAFTP